jgi:CHAT domain-containing protein
MLADYHAAQIQKPSFGPKLASLLRFLGDKVMGPVADVLRRSLAPEPPGFYHVTLIPTGRLASLPLHAAPYAVEGGVTTLLDEHVVSFVPSARVMAQCRRVPSPRLTKPTLFAIGNPQPLPAPWPPLEFSRFEVEALGAVFDGRAHLLQEEQCGLAEVDQHLGDAEYLHFSCHGRFDPQQPLKSGMLLRGGEMLRVHDLIVRQRLSSTRLVALSACQTALADFRALPEEVVGLPSAFLQAGVPAVVGALWTVNDLSTALLMARFYALHLRNAGDEGDGPLEPAAALRKAQLWLRAITNEQLAELFDAYRHSASGHLREVAREKYRQFTLRDPQERPFENPYYWAAFNLHGA